MSTLEELQKSIDRTKESQNMQNSLQNMAPENISESDYLRKDMERRGVKIVPRKRGRERKEQGLQLESLYTGAETQVGEYVHGIEQLSQTLPKGHLEQYSMLYGQPQGETEESKQRAQERRIRYEESYAENPGSTAIGSFGVDVAAAINPFTRRAGATSLAGKIFGGAAGMGAHAGALSGAQYATEEESRLNNMFVSGGIGSLFGAAGGGLGHLFDVVKPSAATSAYSPEELLYNLEASKGLSIGLGTVIGNPPMQFFQENVLARIPGGASKTMQETSKGIKAIGEDLYRQIGGQSPGTKPSASGSMRKDIEQNIQKTAAEREAINRENFGSTYKLADEEKVFPRKENFRAAASDELYNIELDPDTSAAVPEQVKALLNKFSGKPVKDENLPEDWDEFSKLFPDDKIPGLNREGGLVSTFKEANTLRSFLGDKAAKADSKGDSSEARIYHKLWGALTDDMDNAGLNAPSAEVRQKYSQSLDYYKEKILPLQDKDVSKFVNDKGLQNSSKITSTFFKANPDEDNVNQINKALSLLDDKNKEKFRQTIFAPAKKQSVEGKSVPGPFNPVTFSRIQKSIGPDQKQALFSGGKKDQELLMKLESYSHLVDSNSGSRNIMFNPPTGQKAIEALLLTGLGGAGAYGYQQGGLPGLVAAPLALIGAGKGANKFLTSEKVRESVVGNMIKGPQASALRNALEELSRRTATPLATQFNNKEAQ